MAFCDIFENQDSVEDFSRGGGFLISLTNKVVISFYPLRQTSYDVAISKFHVYPWGCILIWQNTRTEAAHSGGEYRQTLQLADGVLLPEDIKCS